MSLFKKNKYPAHLRENLSFGKQAFIFAWEIAKVVVISLAIIVPVRYFLIKPFYVLGASMEPNFYNHEYLIINEISYYFSEPKRGDTVVVKDPFDPRQYFIKRVVGLPGEEIRISAGQVYIHGQNNPGGEVLAEDYLAPGTKTLGEVFVKIKAGEYYLLGDNRSASLDSRMFGPVKRDQIIGKTLLRGWPLSRFGLVINNAEYNF
ncbi:MAG: signal peptidase I [Candidatus Buchananbacteria bacterium RIFCSPHIGHO2_02_FULL_45_11b]|uniref:Signal peptidase I n=2 Tax=Candidatus Buchananiibacteriota TaxID=1817903 RepID=A0A1G1YHS8_9BACT|nr:MAG: signal peptidase I [Candidatus Buchananbacteria bacterium RIFCSPHIGHO2_02_FULL_45_11b]OGY57054.1 MAG: signal peptidase I [Candidatus Buchananbacteria bacterium RIFCSPLOWO2_02_FULL_46_11b]